MGENLKGKELKKVIKDFDFIPSNYGLVVTINKVENNKGVITSEDALDQFQYVVASGESAKYNEGERIMLDFRKLTVLERSKHDQTQTVERIQITPFTFDKRNYTIIDDNKVLGKFK